MYIKKIFISITLVLTLIIGGVSLSPQNIFAEQSCTDLEKEGGYCLIEPLQIGTNQVYDRYDPKTTGIGSYVNLIIKVFIGIIGVLGVIMIVLGGIQYMSTDAISKKEGGKEMITHSIFGLILALSSFLILNTINPQLVEIKLQPQSTHADVYANSVNDGPPEGGKCTQSPTYKGTTITSGMAWSTGIGSDTVERKTLTDGHVLINAVNCSTVGATGCTSVAGYTNDTLSKILATRNQACGNTPNCTLTVTGGTECWLHKTHGPGLNTVDLRQSDALNKYITGSGTFPNDGKVYTKNGHSFLAEKSGQFSTTTGAHWHVNFGN